MLRHSDPACVAEAVKGPVVNPIRRTKNTGQYDKQAIAVREFDFGSRVHGLMPEAHSLNHGRICLYIMRVEDRPWDAPLFRGKRPWCFARHGVDTLLHALLTRRETDRTTYRIPFSRTPFLTPSGPRGSLLWKRSPLTSTSSRDLKRLMIESCL